MARAPKGTPRWSSPSVISSPTRRSPPRARASRMPHRGLPTRAMGSSWCGSAGRGAIAWAQVVGQNSTPIASPLAIAVGAGNAFEPDVSCDGSGCLVVWRDDAGAISARRVDPESSMLVGDELTLSSAGGARPEIENGAGVHLVSFGSENALRGLRVAPDGTAPTFCWRGRPRRRATAGRCARRSCGRTAWSSLKLRRSRPPSLRRRASCTTGAGYRCWRWRSGVGESSRPAAKRVRRRRLPLARGRTVDAWRRTQLGGVTQQPVRQYCPVGHGG